MRKCRRQSCRTPLPTAKLSDKWQAKGFCTVDCMAGHGMDRATKARERQHKAETKTRRDKIKSKTEWLNEAQTAFNAYVRERDRLMGLGCISCGTTKPDIQYHAGHYRTRKAAPQLRFDEDNCHRQCSACNLHLSGNLIKYRMVLQFRIGDKDLERIENDNSQARFTIEDAKRIKAEYKAKLAELKKRQP
jgi:hypothetical protein